MAIGPFARILAQLVVPVVAVLARAIPAAYGQALQNARKAGGAAAADAATNPIFGKKLLSHSEALQILNLADQKVLTPEAVQKQFDKFMAANDVKRGGSFYLQSKFYRANELLQEYIEEQQQKSGTTAGVPVKPEEEEADSSTEQEQQQQSK